MLMLAASCGVDSFIVHRSSLVQLEYTQVSIKKFPLLCMKFIGVIEEKLSFRVKNN